MKDDFRPPPMLGIAAVERDTGLSKDTLRVWERRYGFPAPVRDEHGERLYAPHEVARLRLLRRLLDQGHRPARIIGVDDATLERLLAEAVAVSGDGGSTVDPALLQLVRLHRSAELAAALRQALLKQGLQRFVADTLAPLVVAVGEAWVRGELAVPDEHLFTEQVQNLLRSAIGAYAPVGGRPRIMLTTFPDEGHVLGLLMAEAMLVPEGATCLSLGTAMPLQDIVRAAREGGFDIVGLSFSAAYPARQAVDGLLELRAALPPHIALWAGGEAVRDKQARLPGIEVLGTLGDILAALHRWRDRAGAAADPSTA